MNKNMVLFSVMMLSCFVLKGHSEIVLTLKTPRPASVNNATTPHFRAIFNQQGNSCGNACGIGYVFTYEMNALRNVAASSNSNQYPYVYTYHFLNGGTGDSGTQYYFKDAWTIAKENGIPNVADFGGLTSGYPTKWMTGYSKYYNAMKNRVSTYDSIKMTGSSSIDTIKQWLVDHGNGSDKGGIAAVTAYAYGVQTSTIATGVERGKTIITRFGDNPNSSHAYTVVGYNDSIKFDGNGDGNISNSGDQSTREVGAFIIANSWGLSSWDAGFAYVPYRLFVVSTANGGPIGNNHIYICAVKDQQTIKAALKITITHPDRNALALSLGISSNPQSTSPEKTRKFKRQFTYAGGSFPMCGKELSSTIEIGLDISDLLDSVDISKGFRAFLIVDSKNGTGTVDSLALMDYSSGQPVEIISDQKKVTIPTGTTRVSVAKSNISPVGDMVLSTDLVPKNITAYTASQEIQSLIPGTNYLSITTLLGKTLLRTPVSYNQKISYKNLVSSGTHIAIIKDGCGGILFQKKFMIP